MIVRAAVRLLVLARCAVRLPAGVRGAAIVFATVFAAALTGCGGGDGRTTLTVYSPHGRDLLSFYEQGFEAVRPDVDVQFVDMGSQEILDRLRAERANPQADVWFGAPSWMFERATVEGLLAPYTPTWASLVGPEAHDAGNHWWGTYMTPEVIAYTEGAVDSADAPQDWDDVLAPQWNQKVLIRDPVASGSMRAIWGAILLRSMRETGNTAAGWDWLRRLDAQTKEYTLDGSLLVQKLGRREGLISLYNMPDIAIRRLRDSIPIRYLIPKSGTPLLVDAIAIVKDTKRMEAAQAYLEFVTSRDAIVDAMNRFVRIPLRTDIEDSVMPDWLRTARPLLRPLPLDRAVLADSMDVWMKYWDANVRNRGRAR
jgi:iron(III) transport system substrate-binding protein